MFFPSIIQEPSFRHEFHENEKKKRGESVIYYPVLLVVLGAAAFYDVREHRIPNWWFFTGAAVNILLLVLTAESPLGAALFFQSFFSIIFRMTAVILAFFVLFLCRMIGAGDIKMAALICGYLGLKTGMAAIFSGFFLGAVWSLLKLLITGSFTKRISYFLAYIRRLIQTKELTYYYVPSRDGYDGVIPLGLCLFLGTLFIIH